MHELLFMKLKFSIYIIILHTVIAVMAYYLLQEKKLYFFLAEIGIIFSLIIAFLILRSFIKPLEFIGEGKNAIADQDFNIKYIPTRSKEMNQLIEVYNGMIDNIRAERIQVQEQHYFLQKLIEASPNGIIILDYDDKITDLNPKAKTLLALPNDWQKQPIAHFNHPILNRIQNLPMDSAKVIAIRGVESYKCESSSFIHRGFKRKFIIIQELSKEILEAEKRAYGKVIRMMAHEVNNSIGAINSILHSIVEIEEEGQNDEEVLSALDVAIHRNDNLNQFMRNFADVVRVPKPNLERVDLNILLQNVAKLMEAQAQQQNISFQFDWSTAPVFVHIDSRLIEQALVNMIKNAIEAIEQKNDFQENYPQIIFQSFSNGFAIKDNGIGIPAGISEKLFTPFFSTKTTGQGVGLTLIREILINHQATFSLKTVNNWTIFEVKFSRIPKRQLRST